VRKKIQDKWGNPCIKTEQSCDYNEATVDVEFGIHQSGELQYVNVVQKSEYQVYDEAAVAAVKLAAPFPPVPSEMMGASKDQSIQISAHFLIY